jgi:hypothetical protein
MKLSGKCLCGAVSFEGEGDGHFHACHCAMCRAWSGGPVLGARLELTALRGDAAMRAYASSGWGERVFCGECGSHLFWRMADGSMVFAFAGALDQADELTLTMEIFTDSQPKSYALAGDHRRMTEAEYLRSIGAGQE